MSDETSPPPSQPRNGIGFAGLVLGVTSIPAGYLIGLIGIVLGLVAVILGAVGIRRVRRGRATNRGVALTGVVTGVIGMLLGSLLLYLLIRVSAQCTDELGPAATPAQVQQCTVSKFGG